MTPMALSSPIKRKSVKGFETIHVLYAEGLKFACKTEQTCDQIVETEGFSIDTLKYKFQRKMKNSVSFEGRNLSTYTQSYSHRASGSFGFLSATEKVEKLTWAVGNRRW
jgi:hypothetical protein